jgi:hypothetical protein
MLPLDCDRGSPATPRRCPLGRFRDSFDRASFAHTPVDRDQRALQARTLLPCASGQCPPPAAGARPGRRTRVRQRGRPPRRTCLRRKGARRRWASAVRRGCRESRLRKSAARLRRCTSELPCTLRSRRAGCVRRTRWRFSEPTLTSDPAGSPGVFPTASRAALAPPPMTDENVRGRRADAGEAWCGS